MDQSFSCSDSNCAVYYTTSLTKCNQEIPYFFLSTIPNINGLPLLFDGILLIGDVDFFFPRLFMAVYFFKNTLTVLSFRFGYCLSNLRTVLLGPFCSVYLAIAKRSLSVYCLYFLRLSVSSLFSSSITLSKSTWPNVDSS